jgi:hypothetical protein
MASADVTWLRIGQCRVLHMMTHQCMVWLPGVELASYKIALDAGGCWRQARCGESKWSSQLGTRSSTVNELLGIFYN